MTKGYLALVLHAHLPYIRHPEHENFLEEKWFYEALTETYIPLVNKLEVLAADNVPFRLTISFSPPLMSMLTDSLLQERYIKHLDKLIELSEKELYRTQDGPFHNTAKMYNKRFKEAMWLFRDKYHSNLLLPFKKLQESGYLEIIVCAGTHGYLPLMIHEEAVNAQVKTAVETYQRFFDRKPTGMWLPECAYSPLVDPVLKKHDIRYFFTDTHGIMYASHRPRFGIYAPLYCPSGVAAFGRDTESSKQVWSSQEGYPGDYDYREFYRDIGFDLDYEYIKPYIHPDGIRIHTGIKYYRITDTKGNKEPYNPNRAREKAAQHAGNFMFNREQQVTHLAGMMDRKPIIVAPYDAELFGHWWFEGPDWIEYLIRKVAYDQNCVKMITPGDYLEEYPCNQVATPCTSSWGNKGYHEVWLGDSNDWIYRHLHLVADRMIELANSYEYAQGDLKRALNQAARELLLGQSSDWAFIMSTGTMVEYAVKRTKKHIDNFLKLYNEIKYNQINVDRLTHLERKNNIFPDMDYSWYSSSDKDH